MVRRVFSGRLRAAVGALILVLSGAAAPAAGTLPPFAGPQFNSVAPILQQVTPAVVNIAVRGHVRERNPLFQDPFFRRFFDMPEVVEREVQAAGSGVIVDARNGYILTNNHVVDDADTIQVTTKDNQRFTARLVGRDPATDIAVLRIPGNPSLTQMAFGDSDRLQVGDFVLAIGNPFGLGQTVTSGIISALGRSGISRNGGYENFIQTDASINPGNSGGALIDLNGRLIGINTAILSSTGSNVGIGFAVPINMARSVMDQIVRNGSVQRGRIGVTIRDLTPELSETLHLDQSQGAVVVSVDQRSPAARAGIRANDLVVAVDGVPVRNSTELRNKIGLTPVGNRVELTIERDGRTQTFAVEVAPGGRS
ncbi:Do family serine endopeptidase [Inquilinus limosus]